MMALPHDALYPTGRALIKSNADLPDERADDASHEGSHDGLG